MKKLLVVLLAVLGLTLNANALSFRSTQSVCNGTEQIIFYSNGNFTMFDDGVKALSGTYTIDRTTGTSVIVLFLEGDNEIRVTYTPSNTGGIRSMTFRGTRYSPCSR